MLTLKVYNFFIYIYFFSGGQDLRKIIWSKVYFHTCNNELSYNGMLIYLWSLYLCFKAISKKHCSMVEMIWHQSSKLLVTCNTKKVKIIDAEFPLKIYFYLISRCFPLISILSNSVKNPQSQKPSSSYFKHCQLLCPAMISLAFLLYGWVQKRNVSVILEQFVSRLKKKQGKPTFVLGSHDHWENYVNLFSYLPT